MLKKLGQNFLEKGFSYLKSQQLNKLSAAATALPHKQLKTCSKDAVFKIQNQADFDEKVKRSDKLVIVDFHANWCNPCKQLTPILEAIINEKAGAVRLAKVDVDENTDLAMDYNVGSIPALVAMRNGTVLNRLVGLRNDNELRAWIEKNNKDSHSKSELC